MKTTYDGELASVHLNILDVCLDFGSQLLQVLNNRHVDSSGQVGMVICNVASLFTDAKEDVLHATWNHRRQPTTKIASSTYRHPKTGCQHGKGLE